MLRIKCRGIARKETWYFLGMFSSEHYYYRESNRDSQKPRSVRRVASTRSKGEAEAERKNGTNVIPGKRLRLPADMDVPF